MSRYRILDQQGPNYLTCTVAGCVDVFTRAAYRYIVLESLAYCRQAKGLRIFSYVLMSNHLHLIARAKPFSPGSGYLYVPDFDRQRWWRCTSETCGY